MSGAAGLVSGGAGGLSASGGAAGPSQASLSSNASFNVGGNSGIGSGMSIQTIAIMGLIAIAVAVILTRGKK